MIRGTTPTHTFKLPFDTEMVRNAMVIYAQNDVVVLEKEAQDCAMQGDEISVTLSQNDTLKFDCHSKVQIQLRVLTMGGDALASDVYVVSVGKCLNDEVLS